ncbi:hypothetical protein Tco_1023096, partial [Tanacetum coccineum]
VESLNSVRRPQSKDTKLKNRVLKNTNAKSSYAYVRKVSSNVRIDPNKRETKNLNECQSNTSVLNTKTISAVNDDLDNLFGPLNEEYYATSSPEVSDNSAANNFDNDNTFSSSSIVIEEDEAPQIVSSSAEQVATEPNSPVLDWKMPDEIKFKKDYWQKIE